MFFSSNHVNYGYRYNVVALPTLIERLVVDVRLVALSVVYPWGDLIASGEKVLEIRSWHPPVVPIENLLIVQNGRHLSKSGDVDPDGLAVAVASVRDVHPWIKAEARAACSTWEPGWLAWRLDHVRPIEHRFQVSAERRLYEVDVDESLLRGLIV